MAAQLRSGLAVFAIVAAGSSVSAFAQTDTRAVLELARSSSTAVQAYQPGSMTPGLAALPFNLVVTSLYKPVIDQLLRDSPTFRRQCARIAASPQLRVTIGSEPPLPAQRPAALTQLTRYEGGAIRAVVRVPSTLRAPELIAHELEHVLEQLDGIDLRAKAQLKSTGVHHCQCGGISVVYETARAISNERRVASELQREAHR